MNKPIKFYWDADPIAYMGAASAEPPIYYWIRKEGDAIVEISKEFSKAKDAKEWIDMQCWEEDYTELGWERVVGKGDKGIQAAYDATDEVVKDYHKTSKHFCREGVEPIVRGFLTSTSTVKTKNNKGLEDEYQGNRTGEKPKYLADCRNYLLEKYTFIDMAKAGWEADTHVVGLAEKAGPDGCTMSIDKDIDQVEGAYHVDMNLPFKYRECKLTQGIGDLWKVANAKGKENVKGDGFKFLCYQAVAGDASDGYKGLYRVGPMKVYDLLVACKTKQECVEALRSLYQEKSSQGYVCKKMSSRTPPVEPLKGYFQYESWDGQDIKKTVEEMMQQHFELAYQERSSTDKFNVWDYLK